MEHSVFFAGRERSRICIRSNSQPPQPDASIARLGIDGEAIGHGVLGFSVLQAHSFYGLPWMAARAVIELVQELVQRGGGFGLFAGCAAGDSAMAVVVEVLERRRS